jgi:hypothetical protein
LKKEIEQLIEEYKKYKEEDDSRKVLKINLWACEWLYNRTHFIEHNWTAMSTITINYEKKGLLGRLFGWFINKN